MKNKKYILIIIGILLHTYATTITKEKEKNNAETTQTMVTITVDIDQPAMSPKTLNHVIIDLPNNTEKLKPDSQEYQMILWSFIHREFKIMYDDSEQIYKAGYGIRSAGMYNVIPFREYKSTIECAYMSINSKQPEEIVKSDPAFKLYKMYQFNKNAEKSPHAIFRNNYNIIMAFEQENMELLKLLLERRRSVDRYLKRVAAVHFPELDKSEQWKNIIALNVPKVDKSQNTLSLTHH